MSAFFKIGWSKKCRSFVSWFYIFSYYCWLVLFKIGTWASQRSKVLSAELVSNTNSVPGILMSMTLQSYLLEHFWHNFSNCAKSRIMKNSNKKIIVNWILENKKNVRRRRQGEGRLVFNQGRRNKMQTF